MSCIYDLKFLIVDMKTLEAAKLPPKVDQFLYGLAAAEGMTKLN